MAIYLRLEMVRGIGPYNIATGECLECVQFLLERPKIEVVYQG